MEGTGCRHEMEGRGWDAVGCKTNKTHAQNTLPQFLQWCLRSTRLNFTRHSLHLQSQSAHQRQKKTQFTKFRPSGRKRGGKRTLRPRNRASSGWSDQFQGDPTEEQRSNFGMYYTTHTLQNTQRTWSTAPSTLPVTTAMSLRNLMWDTAHECISPVKLGVSLL